MIRWIRSKKIIHIFQRQLLVCVIIALAITCVFMIILQFNLSRRETNSLLYLNLQDVRADISDWSDENLLEVAHAVADDYPGTDLDTLADLYHVADIHVIDEDGIVIDSTGDYIGYDMRSGEQSSAFLVLLSGETEFVQEYQPISADRSISRKYAGVTLPEGGFLQVGYDAEQFQEDLAYQVHNATKNRHIGEDGFVLIADADWTLVSDPHGGDGENLSVTGLWIDTDEMPEDKRFYADVYGEECDCMYETTEGYYIISVYPKSEAVFSRNLSIALTVEIEVIIFAILFVLIYFLIRRLVVQNIHGINASLAKITEGDLDVVLEDLPVEEFSALSGDINTTVGVLKRYIDEAEHQNERELLFAEQVQYATLPNIFPPYPERDDLDLYAAMYTAKEVGGDFYDFSFVGKDRLAFLIADVSGKGIPAAMFMMRAKTLIKSLAESCQDAGEALTQANEILCENNDANMFVTVWLGILDLKTGMLEYANAGHNPPLIRRDGAEYERLSVHAGFVLAGLPGVPYQTESLQLSPGDLLFLYTDGITEATNADNELYEEDRLLARLNATADQISAEELCAAVRQDVDTFVGDAPQFDDMTMLALRYRGEDPGWTELTVDASVDNIGVVTDFVDRQLEKIDCPTKAQSQINVAIDELFGNIARYAYPDREGTATIRVETVDDPREVRITLIDRGIPYDPLAQETPDTTLSAEEREIGGLGIFLVKNIMDDVSYMYRENCNIVQITKKLEPEEETV